MQLPSRCASSTAGALLCLLIAACGAAEGESLKSTGADSSTLFEIERPLLISGGTVDAERGNVMALGVFIDGGAALCTASLIAPNLLLTAQHCIATAPLDNVVCDEAKFGTPYSVKDMLLSPSTELTREGPWLEVAEVYTPPPGNDLCGFDIALVRLVHSISSVALPPLTPRIHAAVQEGESYTAVGYGTNEQDQESAGIRRSRSELSVVCAAEACGERVKATEWGGDSSVCEGDSGGPALDADGQLIGVASRGAAQCGTPIYSGVSPWRDWIVGVAIDAAHAGNAPPPAWTVSDAPQAPEANPLDDAGMPDDAGVPPPGEPAATPGCATRSPGRSEAAGLLTLYVLSLLLRRRRPNRLVPRFNAR